MANEQPLPSDVNGRRIQGGSQIAYIDNISITTGSYSTVLIPSDTHCKAVLLKTRSANAFRLATSATPTNYVKISNPIAFNIKLNDGDVLGYVRADSSSDTLEVIYLD